MAIAPDGTRAYVTGEINNGTVNVVFVIDTATDTVIGAPIPLPGEIGVAVAITPDGTRAYVAAESVSASSVTVIDTATNMIVGLPIAAGKALAGLAITPDGTRAYFTDFSTNAVSSSSA